MGKQVIGIGTTANDGTGDAIRTAFDKVNQNFTELYDDELYGEVNSVIAGTGVSVSSATGNVTVTNSAPDQTVSLTDGGNMTITGTYPNFTLASNDVVGAVSSVQSGSGISVDQTTGIVTVTNSDPDQTVVLTGGTSISTSGTYPSFTITNDAPDQTVAITDSYGIDSSGTYPNFTLEVSGTIDQNGSASELKYWSGSQAQYDALTPNANTIYFIS